MWLQKSWRQPIAIAHHCVSLAKSADNFSRNVRDGPQNGPNNQEAAMKLLGSNHETALKQPWKLCTHLFVHIFFHPHVSMGDEERSAMLRQRETSSPTFHSILKLTYSCIRVEIKHLEIKHHTVSISSLDIQLATSILKVVRCTCSAHYRSIGLSHNL